MWKETTEQRKARYLATKKKSDAQHAAWAKNHKEHLNEYNKAHRLANIEHYHKIEAARRALIPKDVVRERNKNYNTKNKEKLKIIRDSMKDEISKRQRRYNLKRKDKVAAYAKEYRKKNGGRLNANSAKWRARVLAGSVGEDDLITQWDREWRIKKEVRCYWCLEMFAPDRCHLDHIIPISKGGKHSADNVCISCQPCNNKKRDKDREKWNTHISQPTLPL